MGQGFGSTIESHLRHLHPPFQDAWVQSWLFENSRFQLLCTLMAQVVGSWTLLWETRNGLLLPELHLAKPQLFQVFRE